jgi:hypothetical protein
MTKKEVQQRVLQNGGPLDLDKFEWDENTKTFSSSEYYLVLDFSDVSYCTFDTSYNCIFDTGSDCTFKTSSNCTFNTGSDCTFDTSSDCTFNTSSNCIFDTSSDCTFNTGSNCIFNTSSDCTFNTGSNCTFDTSSDCTFNCKENCVVVRRDVYEVIELNGLGKIKLNNWGVNGYTRIEETKIKEADDKMEEAMTLLKEKGYKIIKE